MPLIDAPRGDSCNMASIQNNIHSRTENQKEMQYNTVLGVVVVVKKRYRSQTDKNSL